MNAHIIKNTECKNVNGQKVTDGAQLKKKFSVLTVILRLMTL